MNPEMIPIRIEEMLEDRNIYGYETRSRYIIPMNVTFNQMKDGTYFFEFWKAGVGSRQLVPDKKICSLEEALNFSENKLRKFIIDSVNNNSY